MSEDDMIWRNPAPNAAAPMVSTGKQKTVQIAVSALTDIEVRLTAALARLDRMTEVVVKAREVIEPFSLACDCLDDDESVSSLWEHGAAMDMNSGHLRAARTLADELDRVLGNQVGEEG